MAKWKRKRSKGKRWLRNQLVNKYGAICFLCAEPFKNMREITLDHYTPLSKGGKTIMENLRLAHRECNQTKAAMTPEEFEQFQKDSI